MKIFKIIVLGIFFLLVSCVSKKKIVYLQGDTNGNSGLVNYEPTFQNDDLISINVLSSQPELTAAFNVESMLQQNTTNDPFKTAYLVDGNGEIEFPVLGTIKVAGFTKTYLKTYLKDKLSLYLQNPIINIRILNFKVSVLGEVNSPGVFNFNNDRITLLDAIANAGDLTLYGQRENILIIRDYLGTKTFNRVDITQADFINSPFYYLDQNDVVYVEPRKAKVDSTALGSNVTSIISILGFLLTTTILLTR